MWSLRQTLLAAVFAALGGGAWWLLQSEHGPLAPAVQRGRVPDYVVSRFSAVETDDTGRPSRRLAADQLRQFVEEDLAELDAPRLTFFEAEGPPWEAQSRTGLLLKGGEEVRLTEAVQIRRPGSKSLRSLRLDTSELQVWPKREYAQGDRPVRIESDRDWLVASGIRLWYAEPGRADFPGRVHMYLAPATAGGQSEEPVP
jgi:lipopolysaccharide export system protein LptC